MGCATLRHNVRSIAREASAAPAANATLQTCNDSPPTGDIMDLLIGFYLQVGNTFVNNGNVVRLYASGAQSSLRSYTYDSLNRLSSMSDTVTAQPCKGLSWAYDNWGNRTTQTLTSGSCGQFSATVDVQNRLHDTNNFYQYDAAGNMTHDASHSYTYNAENRLTAVDGGNTANYYYDASGYRVHHLIGSSTMEYVHDLQGRVVSEILPSGGLNAYYMYFGSKLVAEYYNLTTYFIHQDHLSSTRLVTGYPTPSIAECDDYYPYGEANANVGGCLSGTTLKYKFTGDERDAETNLDHTWFRQNSSALGRWMTPDPAGLAAADPTSPQSWNRYAYVVNNPTGRTDPYGLCDLVVGGYQQGPGNNAVSQFAAAAGADVAFPFSGLDAVGSFLENAFGSASIAATVMATLDAISQSPNQLVNVTTYSGGGGLFSDVYNALPDALKSHIGNITYLSPGSASGGDLAVSQNGTTTAYIGTGDAWENTVTSTVGYLSPDINVKIYACGHDSACAFAQANLPRGPACPVQRPPFTRQNPGGGGAGGGTFVLYPGSAIGENGYTSGFGWVWFVPPNTNPKRIL
jgi:RHS repeat-associated protein